MRYQVTVCIPAERAVQYKLTECEVYCSTWGLVQGCLLKYCTPTITHYKLLCNWKSTKHQNMLVKMHVNTAAAVPSMVILQLQFECNIILENMIIFQSGASSVIILYVDRLSRVIFIINIFLTNIHSKLSQFSVMSIILF